MITLIGKCENCGRVYGNQVIGTLDSIYDSEVTHKCEEGGQEMKKYHLKMIFHYEIVTDDIERTLNEMEFPTFPDLTEDSQVEFLDNLNHYAEVTE